MPGRGVRPSAGSVAIAPSTRYGGSTAGEWPLRGQFPGRYAAPAASTPNALALHVPCRWNDHSKPDTFSRHVPCVPHHPSPRQLSPAGRDHSFPVTLGAFPPENRKAPISGFPGGMLGKDTLTPLHSGALIQSRPSSGLVVASVVYRIGLTERTPNALAWRLQPWP
jgi:hypothetical protein